VQPVLLWLSKICYMSSSETVALPKSQTVTPVPTAVPSVAPAPTPAPASASAPKPAPAAAVSSDSQTTLSTRDDETAIEESQGKPIFIFIQIVVNPLRNFFQSFGNKILKIEQPSLKSLLVKNPGNSQIIPSITQLSTDGESEGERTVKKIPWSPLIIIGVPTFLALIYFGFIASDQYESSADYVIKTQTTSPAQNSGISGILSAVSGSSGTQDTTGSAMVIAYVGSAQILKDISKEIDLRTIYSSKDVDWFSRLKTTSSLFKNLSGHKTRRSTTNAISDEELLKYWTNKVTMVDGLAPGTTTLKVRAFSAEDAKKIADKVLSLSEILVNHASERAVQDAVMFAQKEVDLAHDRAMKAFDELKEFQARAKEVDPQGYVQAQSTIQGTLQNNLSVLQTQMNSLRKQLPDEAPGIQQMKVQIGVLQDQLLSQKNNATATSNGNSASEVITEFGKHQLETQFASQDYLAALTALESARITASQQSRYLEAFDPPNLPDAPSYPWRLYDIITVLAVSSLFYGVWSLFIAAVKEHQH